MGYFAVVLTRTEDGWDANDIDLDEIDDLTDLADEMRESSSEPDATFLLFFEQEDAWFAVVRVDGEDDPRVFVSDSDAGAESAYAEMLLDAATGARGTAVVVDDLDEAEAEADDDEDDSDDDAEKVAAGPVGDSELLSDLGTSSDALLQLCAKEGMLPSEVLSSLAEAAGAGEALESVR